MGIYRNGDICFHFGKYESLWSEIYSEFSLRTTAEECKFFPDFLNLFTLASKN